MKFVEARTLADPEVAARKIVELANACEPYFDKPHPDRRSTGRSFMN
jgi:hypothetical protein